MIDIDNYIILVGIADDKYLLVNTTTPEDELKLTFDFPQSSASIHLQEFSFNSSSGVVAICEHKKSTMNKVYLILSKL